MKNALIIYCIFFTLLTPCLTANAQPGPADSVDNLKHSDGYITSEYGAIPSFEKKGKGKVPVILIPGWGFDGSVFDDFVKANKGKYTMYVVTLPGFGDTKAPPMPPQSTSYGDQTWNEGTMMGIVGLIKKERIERPVVAGHFVQGTQLAINIAIHYPELVGGVVILGGPAKFVLAGQGDPKQYTLKRAIYYADEYWSKKWFKPISQVDFNKGNYAPSVYSVDSMRAQHLWSQVASVNLPVMVRYICEYFASDITLEIEKVKCPVLVLRPGFTDKILSMPVNVYVKPQFIDSWDEATAKNSLFEIRDIPGAGSALWKDKPEDVYREILRFIKASR